MPDPEDQRAVHTRQRTGLSLAPTTRPMQTGIATRLVRKDGTDFPAEIHIGPVLWEGRTAFLAAIRPATD